MANALGLIKVVSNADLEKAERTEQDRIEAAREANNKPLLQGLAKHVMDAWYDAKRAKDSVLPRIQRCHYARAGEYEPDKLAAIREFGGSEVYLRVIANKCRILEAWLKDVYLGQTERPWTLRPTAKPSVAPGMEDDVSTQISQEAAAVYAQFGQMPPEHAIAAARTDLIEAAEERLRDAARKAVQRMERKMADQLSEGGFDKAVSEFIADFVTYPAAVLKGPILRKNTRIVWGKDDTGKTVPITEEQVVPEFERVDPFRAYPAPGASTPQDGYFIEHMTLTYAELYDMLGSPGVNEEALRAALEEAEHGGLSDWLGFTSPDTKPDQDNVASDLKRKVFNIDVLLFWGPVKGEELKEWGLEDPIDDLNKSYEASVMLIGEWVVKAHLNYDPLDIRPYFKASYQEIPGEFWSEGVPDVLDDVGDVVCAGGRAIVNNMAMGSGPMAGINVDRLKAGEEIHTIRPWMLFQLEDSPYGNSVDQPINFYQPAMHAQEILGVIEKFYQFADDFSMIPRYLAGSDRVAGAGRTASGLSMLMDAANKGLKNCVQNVDAAISGMLGKLYNHNMMFDEDETIKGDAQVVARGATSLMQLESLRLRRNEFLQATTNPLDAQIVGIPGRAEILRETVKDLNMDSTRIVPSREALAASAQQVPGLPSDGQQKPGLSQESLMNGAATTDNFSQNSMTPQ